MSEFDPNLIAKHLRKLLEQKAIRPHDYAVADALLWRCREPGREECQISFDRLAKLAGVGRTAAVKAVGKLRGLGLLRSEKTRLRVAWGDGVASRQWRNIYRWQPPPTQATGAAARSANQGQTKKKKKESGIEQAWGRLGRPLLPLRTVEEQLAFLRLG